MATIDLSGFKDMDSGEKIVLDRLLTKWSTRFEEICEGFERLKLSMKRVRRKEKSELYEIRALVRDKKRMYTAQITDRNLFYGVDRVLKKMAAEIRK